MHARELLELAAQISAHGASLARGSGVITASQLQAYWSASKSRLSSWGRDLKAYEQTDADLPAHRRPAAFQAICNVISEIVATEALTRVWAAVVTAWDQKHFVREGEPVVQSILVGHCEARHRALTLLLHATGVHVDTAIGLNRLRRHSERWTDLLIGYLLPDADVSRFACQPQRATQFAADLHNHPAWQAGQGAWRLLLASLRSGFRYVSDRPTPNAELNARIAASIVQCFQPHAIDLGALCEPAWTDRVMHLADDAEDMIQQLL